ncbi:unnamed protein product [Penicillium roqueforti FM164]|uniref:Genomic scaffold, ProqFM164S02 n=1 Tax=Penicillium roqueforti (strain FM164) TaxID=1365484 RepID=W6Q4E0_PENRF|nr:unnamed protein product [Penicillium roqueforti FM164]
MLYWDHITTGLNLSVIKFTRPNRVRRVRVAAGQDQSGSGVWSRGQGQCPGAI